MNIKQELQNQNDRAKLSCILKILNDLNQITKPPIKNNTIQINNSLSRFYLRRIHHLEKTYLKNSEDLNHKIIYVELFEHYYTYEKLYAEANRLLKTIDLYLVNKLQKKKTKLSL